MSNKKKILVIDDDSDFLESMQLMLIMDGYDVLALADGNTAVAQYKEFAPDMVLLDVKMPGIDGYETFLRLKNNDSDARIVFTSSYVLDNAKYREAKAKSLAGLVNKPISLETLRKTIKRHAK